MTPPTCIDDYSFAAAYKRGFLATLKLLRAIGANADIAEEVAQAAWARGWQYRAQLIHAELVGAWVNSIARSLYRNVVAGGRRFEELADAPAPNQLIRELEVNSMMSACSESESRILSMFYFEGYSTLEIAQKVGMQPTTVRVRLMRIRRSLRDRLSLRRTEAAQAA